MKTSPYSIIPFWIFLCLPSLTAAQYSFFQQVGTDHLTFAEKGNLLIAQTASKNFKNHNTAIGYSPIKYFNIAVAYNALDNESIPRGSNINNKAKIYTISTGIYHSNKKHNSRSKYREIWDKPGWINTLDVGYTRGNLKNIFDRKNKLNPVTNIDYQEFFSNLDFQFYHKYGYYGFSLKYTRLQYLKARFIGDISYIQNQSNFLELIEKGPLNMFSFTVRKVIGPKAIRFLIAGTINFPPKEYRNLFIHRKEVLSVGLIFDLKYIQQYWQR